MAALCASTVLFTASCMRMEGPEEETEDPYPEEVMTLGISLRTRVIGEVPGYETGSGYENYIDIAGSDYRIYFFTDDAEDGNDRFIARFEPSQFIAGDGDGTFAVVGKVPSKILNYSDFKLLVLANLGDYMDGEMVPESEEGTVATTIGDLVGAEWSRFAMPEDFRLGRDNLIPLYGVQEYRDVEFSLETMTQLTSPVSLLRAMAKVEVVLRTAGTKILNVRLCRYNDLGYSAPEGVYDGSYATDGASWTTDGIHLVGGTNADQTDVNEDDGIRRREMFRAVSGDEADEDAGIYETWIAYVPEYDNDGEEDYSFIEVVPEDGNVRTIYFAEYSGGETSAYDPGGDRSGRFDIQRNRLYRFTAEISGSIFSVGIDCWDDSHDNDFTFDGSTMSDDDTGS